MRELGHVPALDALRGIAIVLVLAVHAGGAVPGGVLGVDLFFVLSGFLITSLLLSEWGRAERISFRSFYRRRALRLLPALFPMLAAVTVIAAFSGGLGTELTWVFYSLCYVTNLAAFNEGGIAADDLKHMWTLAQEEQFYLVWPLVLVALLRAGIGPRVLAALLGLLAAGVISYRFSLALGDATNQYLWYAPDARSDGLILGCLGGVLFSYGLVRRIPLALASILLVPASLAVFALDLANRAHAAVLLPTFTISASIILLACALHSEWWFTRVIDRAWLRALGRISYGVYLWHLPMFFLFGWQTGLPLTIVIAALSFRYVERPFLRRRATPRATQRIAGNPLPQT